MVSRWKHQEEDFLASRDLPAAAIHWEPRLGKSRLAIETAQHLYDATKVDAALVVAPQGIHLNWSRVEVPTYWRADPPTIVEWDSSKSGGVRYGRMLDDALRSKTFVWLCVNVEAVATPRLSKYLHRFVRARRCILLLDESHSIKNPKAARTKALMRLVWPQLRSPAAAKTIARPTPTCPYRRTLTGTWVSESPFDLWAPYYVLDPDILGRVFTTFRSRYAEFRKNRQVRCRECGAVDRYKERWARGGRRFLQCLECDEKIPLTFPLYDELVEYRNLDELMARIAPITFERKKKDCLDLPPRIMKPGSDVVGVTRLFQLPPAHRRAYDQMREEFLAELATGDEIHGSIAITRLLRLHQIARGHATTEDGRVVRLGGPYPAAEATADLVQENLPGKSIVWCRFAQDVDILAEEFTRRGVGAIVCDGRTPQADRPALRDRYRDDPEAKVWLGTPATGGAGVDLGAGNLMIFYSNGYGLVERMQALERNYGSSQKASRIEVVEIVAADTVDTRALEALERKEDLASTLSKDRLIDMLGGPT